MTKHIEEVYAIVSGSYIMGTFSIVDEDGTVDTAWVSAQYDNKFDVYYLGQSNEWTDEQDFDLDAWANQMGFVILNGALFPR